MASKTNSEARRTQAKQRARRRGLIVGGGILAVVAAVAIAVAVAGGGGTDERPALAVTRFDGFNGAAPVDVADFRGKPLVINFWASWCVPCLAEMPGFDRVYRTRQDSVAFLGVNLADDRIGATAVVEQTGVTYHLAADPDGNAFTALGGFGMPTTIFVDADGRVVELYTGELTAEELEARIERYFGA